MHRIWLKNSRTGEVRGTNSEKEARRFIEVGGSNDSNWSRVVGRKDNSPYVKPKKSNKSKEASSPNKSKEVSSK